jgi:hypothetical protein
MYQASEESWRSSGSTWAKAFDAAQAGSDIHMWAVEEAAWNTYRSAAEARNLASQFRDQLHAQARDQARREAMERLAQGNGTRTPIASAPTMPSSMQSSAPSSFGAGSSNAIGTPEDEPRSSGMPTFRLETSE